MPKRCLKTFLYSLPRSSLLQAQKIYHLLGKDHALTFSEALILLWDIWYMPGAGKVPSFKNEGAGKYLQSYICSIAHAQRNILLRSTVVSWWVQLHDRKWASWLGLSCVDTTIWNTMSRGKKTCFLGLHCLHQLASLGDFALICQEIYLQTISFFSLSVCTLRKRAGSIKLLFLYIFVLLSSSL